MKDIWEDILLNRIFPPAVVIFESPNGIYLVLCLIGFGTELVIAARTRSAEAAFAAVKQHQ